MRLAFAPYNLIFKEPAGTSRGVLTHKLTYFLKLYDENAPQEYGIGEAPLFKGLSAEDNDRYGHKLAELAANVAAGRGTDLSRHPSIQFGLEQAIRDFSSGGKGLYFPSGFTDGEQAIVINGLIWMGDKEVMFRRLEEKINAGFRCIKMKIGAIDWQSELELLRAVRSRFSADTLTLRVDANGAFRMENVFPRLKQLSGLQVHSIEQPIPAGNPELMNFISKLSPVPVALDEELIGKFTTESKIEMLDAIRPHFIILKPALCGGFHGAEEWIGLAGERGIGWWVTSALESNVGLNALAQWTFTLGCDIPQGLGTGALYTNNTPSLLSLESDELRYDINAVTDRTFFDNLDWRV